MLLSNEISIWHIFLCHIYRDREIYVILTFHLTVILSIYDMKKLNCRESIHKGNYEWRVRNEQQTEQLLKNEDVVKCETARRIKFIDRLERMYDKCVPPKLQGAQEERGRPHWILCCRIREGKAWGVQAKNATDRKLWSELMIGDKIYIRLVLKKKNNLLFIIHSLYFVSLYPLNSAVDTIIVLYVITHVINGRYKLCSTQNRKCHDCSLQTSSCNVAHYWNESTPFVCVCLWGGKRGRVISVSLSAAGWKPFTLIACNRRCEMFFPRETRHIVQLSAATNISFILAMVPTHYLRGVIKTCLKHIK